MVVRLIEVAGLFAITIGVGLWSFLPHSAPMALIVGGVLSWFYAEYGLK